MVEEKDFKKWFENQIYARKLLTNIAYMGVDNIRVYGVEHSISISLSPTAFAMFIETYGEREYTLTKVDMGHRIVTDYDGTEIVCYAFGKFDREDLSKYIKEFNENTYQE